jgi:serine/threonine protein kinase
MTLARIAQLEEAPMHTNLPQGPAQTLLQDFRAPGSPKLTLGGPRSEEGDAPSPSATLLGVGSELLAEVDLGTGDDPPVPASAPAETTSAGRTTVLPRRGRGADNTARAVVEQRPRFARVRMLGQGAMGQVELARDNDIRRTVALKRVLPKANSEHALLRFADEVRVIGQLEHPGIVPVYDVGRDEEGQLYLVMKHLHGETMEQIIDKLNAGLPEYTRRFAVEYRLHLFFAVLDAMRYAHARGILHRDLKPANIMIGPFGEVTVMDWGIAKPITRGQSSSNAEPLERTLLESHDQRLHETQLGSLAGTPLYMSPEQAAGRNAELDERSDVYSLCVLLFEWLTLDHPLRGKNTITEVLAAVISHDYERKELFDHAHRAGVPIEYMWVLLRGLSRDRKKRFQSVTELEEALKGRIAVQCHVTLAKRASQSFSHWVDRHAALYSTLFASGVVAALTAAGYGVLRLLH